MTTLAWCGKEMAADSQATSGALKALNATKIFKEEHYIMAFSGSIDEGYMFKAVLDDELKAKDCSISKDFCSMVWWDTGDYEEYFDGLVAIPFDGKFNAMGSGAAIALAAMDCGKTASEAIAIAKKYDIYTGGRVIAFSWEKQAKGKRKKNEQLRTSNIQEPVCEIPPGAEPQRELGRDSKEIHGLHSKASSKVRFRT